MRFVKIDNFWWELDENTTLEHATIYNMAGGRSTNVNVSKYEIVKAKDWEYLNWKGTSVYDNSYETGWVNPAGEFFGCDYRKHNLQAELVHHKTEYELEQEGFLKIAKSYLFSRYATGEIKVYFAGNLDKVAPTPEQIRYVKDNVLSEDIDKIVGYLKRCRIIHLQKQAEKEQAQKQQEIEK